MSHIKTREKVHGIKVLDKGAVASERMRSAFIRTKQSASALEDRNASSENGYASDSVQNLSVNALQDASNLAVTVTKSAARKGRELARERVKNRVQTEDDSKPENPAYDFATHERRSQAADRSLIKVDPEPGMDSSQKTSAYERGREHVKKQAIIRQKEQAFTRDHKRQAEAGGVDTAHQHQVVSQRDQTIKTTVKSILTIKQSSRSKGKVAVKPPNGTFRTSRRTVKTAELSSKMAVRTSQAAAKATQKAAAATAKTAQRTAQAAKAATKAAEAAAKTAAKAVTAAVKALIAAVKELVAVIAAGGWVAVLVVVVVVLIVAVIASPFGIFFSGDSADKESIPATVAIAQINDDFNSRLEVIQDGDYDEIVLEGSPADWMDVLAVFAVKVAGAEDASATYVASLDNERVEKLKLVFYDMTYVSSFVEVISHPDSDQYDEVDDSWSESVLHIKVSGVTADDAAVNYRFSDKQKDVLTELLAEREMLRELVRDLHCELIKAREVLRALPDDLSPERHAIIKTACSLVGKVNYFWGGKSLVIGWNSLWGTIQKVWADGSSTTGTYRPYGLDCSGFVDWVFYNATKGMYYPSQGGGALDQHANSTPITWEAAQPGDLVFYPDDEHVGIVAGFNDDGNILIVHCASGYNNVVITGIEGFVTIATPLNLS